MTDQLDQLFYFANQEPSIKQCNAYCYSQHHVHKCFKGVELWAGRMAKDITQKDWMKNNELLQKAMVIAS
jgi:hypothetical protein